VLDGTTGTLLDAYDYAPYGSNDRSYGNTPPDYRFAGLLYHSTSGLNLGTYRALDGVTGRFLNRDPVVEVGGTSTLNAAFGRAIVIDPKAGAAKRNFYDYAYSAPTRYRDPSGLQPPPTLIPVVPGVASGTGLAGILYLDLLLAKYDWDQFQQLCAAEEWQWCSPSRQGLTRMPDQDNPNWEKARDECHEKCWGDAQKNSCRNKQPDYRKCMHQCMDEHPNGPFSY
jgi:RHS repeat-associated protein